MDRGKKKCRALKELRKRIAHTAGIPYEPEECTHQGPCRGTCPKCEQELRQLQDALHDKESRGEYTDLANLMGDEELCRMLADETATSAHDDTEDNAPILMGIETIPERHTNRPIAEALMQQLLKSTDKGNTVFSPLGVASILTMLRHGTREAGWLPIQIDRLLDGFSIRQFDRNKPEGVTLEHGTGLWYDRSLGLVNQSYVASLRHTFGTEPADVDFTDRDAVKGIVEKWAQEHTHGMIRQLDLQLTPDILMLIVDALYMKGAWEEPFDPDGTRRRTFTNADGTTSRVEMMHVRTRLADYENTPDFQAISLQYSGCDVCMTIVLPHQGRDLAAVMRHRHWLDVDRGDERPVELHLPRFGLDSKVELEEPLTALGLGDLFNTETSLPRITQGPAHVSRIFQQCAVSVDEQGTEAAAVTVAEMEVGCLPPHEKPKCHRMTIDRPFGFAIQDCDGNVLFIGMVNHLDSVEPVQPPRPTRVGRYITSVTVAGTSHIKNIDALADDIAQGTELQLRHEADNPHDRNAIGIYLGDERVGYVPRDSNRILANLLDAGLDLFATVTETGWHGSWFNIHIDILLG